VLVEHRDLVSCVVMTDGNRSVVSGSHDTRLIVWNLEKGDVEHQLRGHTGPVTGVSVTSDGSIAVSGTCFVTYFLTICVFLYHLWISFLDLVIINIITALRRLICQLVI